MHSRRRRRAARPARPARRRLGPTALLHHPPERTPARRRHPPRAVVTLAEFVAAHRAGTPVPPVVTGDLNAWPDSDEVRLLGGYKTAPAVAGQVLLDAWEYADPKGPSATWDPGNPFVPPSDPAVRVDYVFVGPPGPGGLGHVRSVERVGDGPVDGVWPSDHAAVTAELADGPSPT